MCTHPVLSRQLAKSDYLAESQGEFCPNLREAGDPNWQYQLPDLAADYKRNRHAVLTMLANFIAEPCVATGAQILERVFGDT